MATMFVALQCAHCSTMQVKQKKKNNKWVCVVCNLRQSVCWVYEQGPRARDVRQFVQEFNMSRMEIGLSDTTDLSLPASDSNRCIEACQPKKRMDWGEYLDPVEETEDDKNKETELDMEIVTEMPLQKPKITSSKHQQKNCENNLFCEDTCKRKRGHEGTSKQSNSCSIGRKEAKIHMLSNQRSRWSEYLDDINKEETGDETVNGGCYSFTPSDIKEKIATEHLVEDEVHPDFT